VSEWVSKCERGNGRKEFVCEWEKEYKDWKFELAREWRWRYKGVSERERGRERKRKKERESERREGEEREIKKEIGRE